MFTELIILTKADELQGLKEEKEEKEEKKEKEDETEATPELDENGEPIAKVEVAEGEEKPEGAEVEEPAAKVEESPDIILDFNEETEIPIEIDDKIPKYNCNRQLGSSMITKLECYECRVCERFFDNEITAEIHSRTVYHHRQYVKMLNEKANETRVAQKRAAAAAEEQERKKKRKLKEEAEAEAAKLAEEGAVEGELYDPSEATIDDEESAAVVKEEPIEDIADECLTTEEVQDTNVVEEADVVMDEVPQTPVVPDLPIVPVATPISTPSTPASTPKQTPQRGGQNKSGGGGRGGRGRSRGRYGGKY